MMQTSRKEVEKEQDGMGTGGEGERNNGGIGGMDDEVEGMMVDSEAK